MADKLARSCWQVPLLALLYATAASAAVEFEPMVAVGVSHTDNVSLTLTDPQRATIFRLNPSFSLTQEGKRVTTDVDFGVEAYRYDELHENDVYQNLDATLVAALDPDNFFFEMGAARGQTIRDPEAAIPWTTLPLSANRVDRDNFYAGPSFEYPLGDNTTVHGSLRRERIDYDEDATLAFIPEYDTDSLRFSLDNYEKERGFSWAVNYDNDRTDFGVFEPWEFRQAGVELGGWVGSRFRVFAGGGKESAWDNPFDPSLEDNYWETGFAIQSGRSINLEVATGERTFGSSRRASFEATFEHWQTGLEYAEQPTTPGRDVYRDSALLSFLSAPLDDFLTRPGATERYIAESFRWTLGFELSRTDISLAVHEVKRAQRTLLDGSALDDEQQSGADLTVRWRLGARLGVQFAIRELQLELGSVEHRLLGLTAGADYRLGQRTTVSLSLSRADEDSGETELAQLYRADVVTLLLSRAF
jgi:uncharacterized protein (PEP-CTERM system associated)